MARVGTVAALALALAALCTPPAVGRAADRFVSTTGADGGNDCLAGASPCQTVAHGLAQAASGDTVKVAGGIYRENLLVDASTILTVSGGWSSDFAAQDPAANPTSLDGRRLDTVLAVSAGAGQTIDVTLDGLTLTHGVGFAAGGVAVAADADGSASVTVSRCTLRANKGPTNVSTQVSGGGIAASAKDSASVVVTVTDSILISNKVIASGYLPFAVSAGGIAVRSDDTSQLTLSVEGSTVTRSKGSGGGILALAAGTSDLDVAVDGSSVFRNRGDYDAGGVGAYSLLAGGGSLALSVSASAVSRNRGGAGGGGIVCQSAGACTLTNTIVWNNSGLTGEGVKILGTTVAALVNSTVANNPRGGVKLGNTLFPPFGIPVVDVTNSILWNNQVGAGYDLEGVGTANLRNSDVGTGSSSGLTVNDLGGNISVDPVLTTPANGLRLTAGSPCIDTGTCAGAPATDIDGDPRPTGGGCDMGADEFVP